jgi:hypothetical protein
LIEYDHLDKNALPSTPTIDWDTHVSCTFVKKLGWLSNLPSMIIQTNTKTNIKEASYATAFELFNPSSETIKNGKHD